MFLSTLKTTLTPVNHFVPHMKRCTFLASASDYLLLTYILIRILLVFCGTKRNSTTKALRKAQSVVGRSETGADFVLAQTVDSSSLSGTVVTWLRKVKWHFGCALERIFFSPCHRYLHNMSSGMTEKVHVNSSHGCIQHEIKKVIAVFQVWGSEIMNQCFSIFQTMLGLKS